MLVTDQTGAVITLATISVTDTVTGKSLTEKADGNGFAAFALGTGHYVVTAHAMAFLDNHQEIDYPNTKTLSLRVAVDPHYDGGYPGPCCFGSGLETASPAIADLLPTTRNNAASNSLTVTVDGKSSAFGSVDFGKLPHKTVTFHNIHTKADETYSGVPLTDLLAKYGAPTGDKLRGKGLSEYIVATGADGYKAVLALAETDPAFHPGDVIVADSMNGQPLDAQNGRFKLVVTEDKRPARSVHNLVSIELRTAE